MNAQPIETPDVLKGTRIGKNASSEINKNRKLFVEQFNIKKVSVAGNVPNYGEFFHVLDHSEVFYTHDKTYVYTCSPYKPRRGLKDALRLGFKKYAPLYNENAYTFVQTFDSLKGLNEFTKNIR